MVKAYLSRVGGDSRNVGLGPLFDKYKFEYIPIKEDYPTSEDRTFSELDARFSDNKLSIFIKKKYKDSKPHYDPEFETYTYGDPTKGDRKKFLKLDKGDLLVFYAGLKPWDFERKKDEGSCYIIGYFTVEAAKEWEWEDFNKYPQLMNNAHIKRVTYTDQEGNTYIQDAEPGLVVVIGDDKKSKLLEEAIPIGETKLDSIGRPYCAVSEKRETELGIKGSIQRKANGKWIEGEEYIRKLKELLEY